VQVVCEKVDEKGTRVAYKHVLLERGPVQIAETEEFWETLKVPPKAAASNKTIPASTSWCIRVRRRLTNRVSYDTDYPFTVENADEATVAAE